VSSVLYSQLFRTPARYIFRDIRVRDFQCKTGRRGEKILLPVVKTLQHKEFIRVVKAENTYNFYLVIEVPDHVYVLVGKI